MLSQPSFPPWPSFGDEEGDIARNVLRSNRVNYWTGDEGRRFETEFADSVGARHAVAVANGTVALDLAWIALGLEPGDEVIVTPRTFLASVSSIINAGATPIFADVDRESGNITSDTVAPLITAKTKAIECVHLGGWPCEMDGILALARANDLYVVEDCAQANGATYGNRSVGSLGDIAAWSFCQDKIITTAGEGGMLTTDHEEWWSRAWSYKDHGKSWQAVYGREHPPGFRWVHESFGTNWRLTEIQSAIGRWQLKQLPSWHEARTRNARALLGAAKRHPALRVPEPPSHIRHAWYRAYVYLRPEALKAGWSRDRIVSEISARGVPCSVGSCSEVYLEQAFENTPFRPERRLTVAQELGETSLAFLVHPTLTAGDLERTADVLSAVVSEATR